jgi:citrate synthase
VAVRVPARQYTPKRAVREVHMAGKPSRGLADVVVAATAVSDVDGRTGRLCYRGYDVSDLAGTATFEEVACLLQRGVPPGRAELAAYRADLAAGQALGPVTLASLPAIARAQPPMAALRTLVSLASADDPGADDPGADDPSADEPSADDPGAGDDGDGGEAGGTGLRAAARLTGRQAALAGAVRAARDGETAPRRDPGLGLAGNLLYQLTGSRPAARAAEIFDACLVLHADHVMSAATFAARVCAATGAGLAAAAAAAVAALGGPLHGGGNSQVMHDLTVARAAGGDPVAAAAGQARARLARGERITGFGHRAYQGEDPRAAMLRGLSAELAAGGDDSWHRMAVAVEEVVRAERGLSPNADFYAATAYHYLGIPPQWRAPVLSVARMAGWAAHVLEQQADNRLIRPGSEYVGEIGLTWTPLADR